MSRKILILISFLSILNVSFSTEAVLKSEEVVVDLNNNSIIAENGIAVNSKNVTALFHKLEKEADKNIYNFSNHALINIDQNSGNIKIETDRGTFNQDTTEGNFYDTFAYINVSKMTGATAPNDKIYFGSPHIKYTQDKIFVDNGWMTTDFKIVNFPNEPKRAGYHLFSKSSIIEPEKQITFRNTDLYIGERDVTPFSFPWFRINIRKDSKVPLFPTIKTSRKNGFEVMWGILYGNRDDKFVGGIAPKFSDKIGFSIGRAENWYKSDKIGETRFNIEDLLLFSKAKKPKKIEELPEYEKDHKRYKLELVHNYDGEKGKLDFVAVNSTINLVEPLTDVLDKFENNNLYKTLGIKRQKYDENIGFYKLSADLKELGKAKDIVIKSDVNLVSNKKAYSYLVYDSIKDAAYDSNIDHDLFSNVSVMKDNSQVRIKASYNYLYDMDPGSTTKDTMSRDERISGEIFHKNSEAGIIFTKRRGNEFRNLGFWEQDVKSKLKQKNILGIDLNYTPTTVRKYDESDYEKVKVLLGKYSIASYKVEPTLDYNSSTKRLNLNEDNYRVTNLGKGRISEYNRFEDNIYNDFLEKRLDLKIYNEKNKIRVGFGRTENKIWNRDGLFDGTHREYKNNSKFYEISLGRKIDFSPNSIFGLEATVRQDLYDSSKSKTYSYNLKLDNETTFIKERNKSFTNFAKIEFEKHHFSGNNAEKEQRLINKSDYLKLSDEVRFKNGQYEVINKIDYKYAKDPFRSKKKNEEEIANKLELKFDEEKSFSINISQDKRYTDRTISGKNLNFLTNSEYETNLKLKAHNFSFSNQKFRYKIEDFPNTIYSIENIEENKFSYSYAFDRSKLKLSYKEGKNTLNTSNLKNIKRKNREYALNYNIYGDVEQDFSFSYNQYRYGRDSTENNNRNTDVYKLSYEYRDKKFEERELLKYATLEYDKDKETITAQDISNIRSILDRRQDFRKSFELTRIKDESFRVGNYKKNFKTYLTLEKNNARYSQTGSLGNSLSKLEGGLEYSHNRVGVGYKFKEEAGWKKISSGYEWSKKNREHEVSIYTQVGKPSQAWKVKTYAKFYDNLRETTSQNRRKRSIDGFGIELSKEMGYYEYGVSYENKYSPSTKNYEWRAGINFTLLTFPNNSIFGVGARNNGNSKTRPEGYLLDRPNPLNKSSF